jgi:DNA-binding MarR family transcriptional regulator
MPQNSTIVLSFIFGWPYLLVMSRTGANLALLLLGTFRFMAKSAADELARRGHHDMRPAHHFAMRAIAAGADNASELGRRLSVTKQAAAKTIMLLEERGYVARADDPKDARRKLVHVTPLGNAVMQQGEAIFQDLRAKWEQQIGAEELAKIEASLIALIGATPISLDAPGDIVSDIGEA